MKKTQIVLMMGLAVMAIGLTGCGKKHAPQPPRDPNVQNEQTSQAEAPAQIEVETAAIQESTPVVEEVAAPAVEAVSQVEETPAAETTQTDAPAKVETPANPA